MFSSNKINFMYLSYKSLYTHQPLLTFVLFRFIDPLMHFLFFILLSKVLIGDDLIEFIIIGNSIFLLAQTMMLNFISMFQKERGYGTLDLNVASPTSMFRILINKSVVPILDSILVLIISICIIGYFFGVIFPVDQIANLLLGFLLIVFSTLGLSLIIASFGLIMNNINLFLNIVLSSLLILCGINFPISLLPIAIQKVSYILPLTNGIEFIREIYLGNNTPWNLLANEILIGLILFISAVFMIKILEKVALKNGLLFKY